MIIKFIGHACFKITEGNHSVVFDPYKDGSVPGLANVREEANEVYCSHGHGDHNSVESITIVQDQIPYILTTIDTYHDDKQGTLRGNNRIHILDWNGKKVAHFGDLGCDLTSEQIAMLKGLDVALIPIGGHYTIDAKQAKKIVDLLDIKVTIPMHYRKENSGYDVIGDLYAFTSLCDHVEFYQEDSYELKGTEKQLVVALSE